ncbi:MAG TPA: hypothetical protein VGE24_04960, partial [Emticicia sp.]
LPALPDDWANGSVSGLCARGGFEVSMTWANKGIKTLTIFSKNGGETTLINGKKTKKISLKAGQKLNVVL